jgi:Tat protein secretion system quality control protein TatD with DNase activity
LAWLLIKPDRGFTSGANVSTDQAFDLSLKRSIRDYCGVCSLSFENAGEVREAAKSVPIERIMVETGAPYFAPAPNRTKRCEPAFIRETAAFIANLRGMSLAAFAARTTQNAQGFFGLST